MKTVHVFKTSVSTHQMIDQISALLDRLMTKGEQWNFDLEDCDHILRVEAVSLPATAVIDTLRRAGFSCVELED